MLFFQVPMNSRPSRIHKTRHKSLNRRSCYFQNDKPWLKRILRLTFFLRRPVKMFQDLHLTTNVLTVLRLTVISIETLKQRTFNELNVFP